MSENAVLEMPRDYVDMDASELEYDGGFNWGKAIGLTIAIAGGITLLAGIPTQIFYSTQLGGTMMVGGFVAVFGGAIYAASADVQQMNESEKQN